MAEELIYLRSRLAADQVEHEIERFWAELGTSPELQAELVARGLEINPGDAILVHEGSRGVDPRSVSIIITFVSGSSTDLKAVWDEIILPRIRRRWGDDAIGSRGLGGDQSGD